MQRRFIKFVILVTFHSCEILSQIFLWLAIAGFSGLQWGVSELLKEGLSSSQVFKTALFWAILAIAMKVLQEWQLLKGNKDDCL